MSKEENKQDKDVTRREFIEAMSAAAVATGIGGAAILSCDDGGAPADAGLDGGDGDVDAGSDADTSADGDVEPEPSRPNLLFIVTDQEHPPYYWFRHDEAWVDEQLPARAFLKRFGVEFTGAHSVAMPCSPSRASLFSGLYAHQHHVYGNVGMDGNYLADFPTCASILKQDYGYRTFYIGKSHLCSMTEYACADAPRESMQRYGFDEWVTAPGAPYVGTWPEGSCYDSVGIPYEGVEEDRAFADSALSWLEREETTDPEAGPWFATLGLVNPHDIMHYPLFEPRDYNTPINERAGNFEDVADVEAYKPTCQGEYIRFYNFTTGGPMPHGPGEIGERKWDTYPDAYLAFMQDCDAQLLRVLEGVMALPHEVRDNLVVVFTSDHGDLVGAHGQRAKGPCMYEEQQNVPLMVVDFSAPALRELDSVPLSSGPADSSGGRYVGALGERRTQLVTLLDVTTTLVSLGMSEEDDAAVHGAHPQLMGANIAPLLAADAANDAVRAPAIDDPSTLVDREHILATCDMNYTIPGPDGPVGVETAFHIVSLRQQSRDGSGELVSDFKLNLYYDWTRDPADDLIVEAEDANGPAVDWARPFEAELYDMTEENPDLREVTTLIPREIPRADGDGLVDGAPMAWPPKWSVGALGRRNAGEFSEAEKTQQMEIYRVMFERLVNELMPNELRRALPEGLRGTQRSAWAQYRSGSGADDCEPVMVGDQEVGCAGL